MSIGSNAFQELTVPDGTEVEEHDLVVEGNVIVGGQSTIGFGVRGDNVIAGERTRFGGHIEAERDCRLDMWCSVADNVLVGRDAYLGERVHVDGQLVVGGDLDIGDDVTIEDGFEANGWIVIRNPMPTVVFLFVYLTHLLRIGEAEAADELAKEVLDPEAASSAPLTIPRGATITDDAWRVSTPATIGSNCRLHGNVRASSIEVGTETEIFGSVRASDDITVHAGSIIHGDVTTRNGTIAIDGDARILGDVSGDELQLDAAVDVDGTLRARGDMTLG